MNGSIDPTVTVTIIISTLLILLFTGLVVLLLVLSQARRTRHRVQVAELAARHAEELRGAEREVTAQTLTEVGRELHDNIGQLLAGTRMGMNRVMHQHPGASDLAETRGTLDLAIEEVRRLSRTLNTERWNELALGHTLAQECERVGRTSGVALHFDRPPAEPALSADEKVVLFRIFQEALNNALKHARPARIDVVLTTGQGTQLRVSDDGSGFDTGADASGQGLRNMRRRAELIGYRCEVSSTPGKGTTVTVARHT